MNTNEIKHTKEHYTCKRLRMLNYLREKGFTPVATIPEPNNVKYNWWLFENTPELQKCVTEYFEQLKVKQVQ